MRSNYAITLLASITAVVGESWTVSKISTKQPNGSPDGQTNYYNIGSEITGASGCTSESAYCWAFWGDNGAGSGNAYSAYAPTGWTQCAHNSTDLYDFTSNYAFKISSPFSIGNFDITYQNNYTACSGVSYEAESVPYHVTNSTSAFICDINPQEVPNYQVHASGTCTTPANSTGIDVNVGQASELPDTTGCSSVIYSFPVTETTVWGDNVFVSGNISALGNWDPYNALALTAAGYTDVSPLWQGGFLNVAPGTAFEYK
ncbi:hypothetical protein LTR17_009600 [Elasticomyces elasticus]|nr:hypothetical protein LTR17_009600 [Elasticomyces elasticus]